MRKSQELVTMKQKLWWRIRKEEERTKFRNRLRDVVERERHLDHKKQVSAIRIESKKELNWYRDAKIVGKNARKVFKRGRYLAQ